MKPAKAGFFIEKEKQMRKVCCHFVVIRQAITKKLPSTDLANGINRAESLHLDNVMSTFITCRFHQLLYILAAAITFLPGG
ncbi:hypothetical protein C7M52_00040 [Mixta theicola]|nr:hypothetical protein C7M52_00040 [Mixta theicola]